MHGYNYEDAVSSVSVLSRMIFIPLYIKEFSTDIREIARPEKLTRDIPNTSEKMLEQLDEMELSASELWSSPDPSLWVGDSEVRDTTPSLSSTHLCRKAKEGTPP